MFEKVKRDPNHYMNVETGELTLWHKTAMEWYRAGDDVDILKLVDGEWKKLGRWVH